MAETYRIKCCVIHTVCKYFEENFLLANICSAYPIYVNFGAPLHYLVLKSAYICNKIAQIVQNKPTFAFSMQKRHRLGKNTPPPVVAVVTYMSYAVVEYFCRAHIFFPVSADTYGSRSSLLCANILNKQFWSANIISPANIFSFGARYSLKWMHCYVRRKCCAKNVLCNYISFPMPDTHWNGCFIV